MKVSIIAKLGEQKVDLNRRQAIKLKCLDCSGFEYSEVTNCHHKDCPLYLFRNGKCKQDPKERDKAIRAFCMWCFFDQISGISECDNDNCPLWNFRGYNHTINKPVFHKKTSLAGYHRLDLPSAIHEHHPKEKTTDKGVYMND